MPTRKVQESRDRKRPLKVVVSERERAEIETRAAATGLSVSAYLRNLGLGFQPQSTLDHEAVLVLLKVNADQAGLAGCSSSGCQGKTRRQRRPWRSGRCSPPSRTASCNSTLSSSIYRDFDVLRRGNAMILYLRAGCAAA